MRKPKAHKSQVIFPRTQSKKAAPLGVEVGEWGVILSWDLEPENPYLNSISFTRPLTISEAQFLYLSNEMETIPLSKVSENTHVPHLYKFLTKMLWFWSGTA